MKEKEEELSSMGDLWARSWRVEEEGRRARSADGHVATLEKVSPGERRFVLEAGMAEGLEDWYDEAMGAIRVLTGREVPPSPEGLRLWDAEPYGSLATHVSGSRARIRIDRRPLPRRVEVVLDHGVAGEEHPDGVDPVRLMVEAVELLADGWEASWTSTGPTSALSAGGLGAELEAAGESGEGLVLSIFGGAGPDGGFAFEYVCDEDDAVDMKRTPYEAVVEAALFLTGRPFREGGAPGWTVEGGTAKHVTGVRARAEVVDEISGSTGRFLTLRITLEEPAGPKVAEADARDLLVGVSGAFGDWIEDRLGVSYGDEEDDDDEDDDEDDDDWLEFVEDGEGEGEVLDLG